MAKISIAYPDTGLIPSISIVNMTTEIQDFSGTMSEIGNTKVYIYEFTEVADTDYAYVITTTGYDTVSDSLFYSSFSSSTTGGLTTAEHDQLFAIGRSMGGGSGFSEIFKSNLANTRNEIIRKIEDKTTDIETKISETNSHINIAKDDIITTIESIDIHELSYEEKEAKKAIKLLTTLDKKVSRYIDSEMSDKEELGAIAKQFSKLEMEDAMKEKQKEIEHKKKMEEKKKIEEEEDKRLLEEIKLEFSKAEEKEKEEKRKELEKELEETLKEAEELKKELKTI